MSFNLLGPKGPKHTQLFGKKKWRLSDVYFIFMDHDKKEFYSHPRVMREGGSRHKCEMCVSQRSNEDKQQFFYFFKSVMKVCIYEINLKLYLCIISLLLVNYYLNKKV